MKRLVARLVLAIAIANLATGCYTVVKSRPPAPALEPAAEPEPQPEPSAPVPDEAVPLASDLDGEYTGWSTLVRDHMTPGEQVETGRVRFWLHAGEYRCDGDNVPAGWGEFADLGAELVLRDRASHTADFDWSLILNGHFALSRSGSSIQLRQRDEPRRRYREITLYRTETSP